MPTSDATRSFTSTSRMDDHWSAIPIVIPKHSATFQKSRFLNETTSRRHYIQLKHNINNTEEQQCNNDRIHISHNVTSSETVLQTVGIAQSKWLTNRESIMGWYSMVSQPFLLTASIKQALLPVSQINDRTIRLKCFPRITGILRSFLQLSKKAKSQEFTCVQ